MSDSFAIPWTVSHQAPLSVGFSRKEYWSGLPFPSPGALPNPEIEPMSPALADRFFTAEPSGKPLGFKNTVQLTVEEKHWFFKSCLKNDITPS